MMSTAVLSSLVTCLLIGGALAADRIMYIGDLGVGVKVLGQSGKIMMSAASSAAKVESDPNRVVVEFDSLTEVDSAGNTVGKSGTPKHSFNSFASQSFAFTPLRNATFQNISVVTFNFSGTLNGLTSRLNVPVYLFLRTGNISIGGVNRTVLAGTIKFSLEMTSWQFCNPCTQGGVSEVGAAVLLTLVIKGKGAARLTNQNNNIYDLGAGSVLTLSNKVRVDGLWETMPSLYPDYTVQGSKEKYTFYMPKFTRDGLYDPDIFFAGSLAVATNAKWLVVLFATSFVLVFIR